MATHLDLNANAWNILYSNGLPNHPTQDGAGWRIDMGQNSELDYVTRSVPNSIKQEIGNGGADHGFSVDFKIDGTPDTVTYQATQGGTPCFTLLIRKGTDLTNVKNRVWCKSPRFTIREGGPFNLNCNLNRQNWSNVDGQTPTNDDWKSIVQNMNSIGFTAGGTFFGHGVKPNGGTSKFHLLDWVAY